RRGKSHCAAPTGKGRDPHRSRLDRGGTRVRLDTRSVLSVAKRFLMSVRLFSDSSSDQMPLLRWLMFTGVSAFAFAIAWHYGLFHLMVANDKTWISTII